MSDPPRVGSARQQVTFALRCADDMPGEPKGSHHSTHVGSRTKPGSGGPSSSAFSSESPPPPPPLPFCRLRRLHLCALQLGAFAARCGGEEERMLLLDPEGR